LSNDNLCSCIAEAPPLSAALEVCAYLVGLWLCHVKKTTSARKDFHRQTPPKVDSSIAAVTQLVPSSPCRKKIGFTGNGDAYPWMLDGSKIPLPRKTAAG
jgi:hypothetical protein